MDKPTMSVKEMSNLLGISLPRAYELTHIQGFPVLQVGRKRIILVEGFNQWLKVQGGNVITLNKNH